MALTSHVHPRLGLPTFLKFEPMLIEALRRFPETTAFEVTKLSPNTVAARMRDSLLGFRLNRTRWESSIDPEFVRLYDQHEGQFVIRIDPEMRVLFTQKRPTGVQRSQFTSVPFNVAGGHLGDYIKAKDVASVSPAVTPSIFRVTGPQTPQQIFVLAEMKSKGAIADPITFDSDIRSPSLESLCSNLDVVFHYDPARNETILM